MKRLPDGSWMTLLAAAKFLGVSPASLRDIKWRRKKSIPSHKMWGRILFRRDDLVSYVRGMK